MMGGGGGGGRRGACIGRFSCLIFFSISLSKENLAGLFNICNNSKLTYRVLVFKWKECRLVLYKILLIVMLLKMACISFIRLMIFISLLVMQGIKSKVKAK